MFCEQYFRDKPNNQIALNKHDITNNTRQQGGREGSKMKEKIYKVEIIVSRSRKKENNTSEEILKFGFLTREKDRNKEGKGSKEKNRTILYLTNYINKIIAC